MDRGKFWNRPSTVWIDRIKGTVIVSLMYTFVFHDLMDWYSDAIVLIHHYTLIVA